MQRLCFHKGGKNVSLYIIIYSIMLESGGAFKKTSLGKSKCMELVSKSRSDMRNFSPGQGSWEVFAFSYSI